MPQAGLSCCPGTRGACTHETWSKVFMLWLETGLVAAYRHRPSSSAEAACHAVKAAIKLAGYLTA